MSDKDWKAMFELKQTEWLELCKEIEAKDAEIEELNKIIYNLEHPKEPGPTIEILEYYE